MNSSRSARDIDSTLARKGFQRTNDGDHMRYYFYDQQTGATLSQTKMSHGAFRKTIGAPLISQMARQLRLTKKQFLELIDCTLEEEGYRVLLENE